MKKKLLLLLTLIPFVFSGCGNTEKNATVDGSFSYSDENYGTATICDYDNLSVTKNLYEVSEDSVAEAVDMLLYDYAEYNEVTRPSKSGDAIVVIMTAVQNGETLFEYTAEDEYSIYLGYEEFGAEFDEKLTGVSTGDELSFSITYPEDSPIVDFAGATIDYTVNIVSITEENIPKLTEEFITDTLGYESQEALEASIREDLEAENESNSTTELRDTLIQQVIDASEFESYSQDLYDSYAASMEESYLSYAEMFGCESTEEVYALFGMTEEDVETEVLNYVYRTIAVEAIAEHAKLTLSDEAYQEGLERYVSDFGYESTDALLADYGEESLRTWIQEDIVIDYLMEHATITEVPVEAEEADVEEDVGEETDVVETDVEEDAEETDTEETDTEESSDAL